MLKVNNKKTINKLVSSSLKQYKMRNFFTLVTIVLSVSLIAGLAFMSAAIEETTRKELSTRQHVIYHEVTQQQIQKLSSQSQISFAKEFKSGQSFEKEDYIIVPYYIEPSSSPLLTLDIAQGQYPQQINEVLVHDQMLKKMGIKPKIGQHLSITYLDGTTEEYIVSGLLEAETTDVFSVYFSKEYSENGSQLKNIPFSLSAQITDAEKMSSEEFLSVIREIGVNSGVDRKNINENNAFVKSLSYNSNQIMMIALIAFAILLVSLLVIYSIFYISISERTRQFGQLRTIGITQKQVKRMVRKEGAVLSLIGSAIGITIGSIFAFSMKPQGFNLITFVFYAIAIFLANYLTVQISIAKPAKLAARVSPIEATRMSGYEVKSKKAQTKNLQRNLSPLSLSMIAARGNRKKSVMTMISLCLAGVVFMCSATFLKSINEEKYARQGLLAFGDFALSLSTNASKVNEHGQTGIQKNNPLSDQKIKALSDIDGVREVTTLKNLIVTYAYNDVTKQEDIAAPFTNKDTKLISQYIKEGDINYNKMIKNKEIIIVHNEIAKEIFGWNFKLGDTLTLTWYNGEKYVEDTFTIGAILQNTNTLYKHPDMFKLSYNAGWFMIPEDLLNEMMIPNFSLNSDLVIACNNYWNDGKIVEEKISAILDDDPLIKVSTLSDQIEYFKEQYDMLYLTFMGTALFVIAFSIINLLNTLISNTMARKREFACLSAIGASRKQIRTMILGEGLYFAAVNIVVTATFGTLMSYVFIKILNWSGVDYLVYQVPLAYLIGYCIFVLIGTFVIAAVIAKIIGKKSLVERLREVE